MGYTNRCNARANKNSARDEWITNKYCQQSCFDNGNGYLGDDCSKAYASMTITWGGKSETECKWQCTCTKTQRGCNGQGKCQKYLWTAESKKCELYDNGSGKKPSLKVGKETSSLAALFGHNQINGPIFPIAFDNKALLSATQAMW